MPCWTTQQMGCEFNATNMDILEKAVKSLGFEVISKTPTELRFYGRYGAITISGKEAKFYAPDNSTVNEVRQQFSREVVSIAASRYRWATKKVNQKKTQFTFSRR